MVVNPAQGLEDSFIDLHIQSGLQDIDGSENLRITISGIPSGAELNKGSRLNESFEFTSSYQLSLSDLEDLKLIPTLNSDNNFNLIVTAETIDADTGDTAQLEFDLPVTVYAVADKTSLTVSNARGSEDTAIALDIQTHLHDQDGSETQHIIISGLPHGALLNQGRLQADGSWKLLVHELTGLTLTPARDSGMSISALTDARTVSTVVENGSTAEVIRSIWMCDWMRLPIFNRV